MGDQNFVFSTYDLVIEQTRSLLFINVSQTPGLNPAEEMLHSPHNIFMYVELPRCFVEISL